MKSRWRTARAAIAVGLTAAVLWQADVGRTLAATHGARGAPLFAALALVVLDRALMCWRWISLLHAVCADRRPPVRDAVRIFFVSTFVGTLLPASVGGDAVRTAATARLGLPGAHAAASVVLDRLLGVVGIVVLAAVGLMLAREITGRPAILAALGVSVAGSVGGIALMFSRKAAGLALRVASAMPWDRPKRFARALIEALRVNRGHRGRIAGVLAASIAVQVLRVLEAWTLGLGLGIQTGLTTYFAFVPLILLIVLLPVTINGIGTSQAAFVWLFGSAGVDPAAAFALSILFLALGVVGNLPGALLYAFTPGTRGNGTNRESGRPV